jgi:hypothetical protein
MQNCINNMFYQIGEYNERIRCKVVPYHNLRIEITYYDLYDYENV